MYENENEVVEVVAEETQETAIVPAEETSVEDAKTGPSKAAIAAGGLGLIGLGVCAVKFGPKIASAIKIKAENAKANRQAKKAQKEASTVEEKIKQRDDEVSAMSDSQIHDTINMLRREEARRKRELKEIEEADVVVDT